MKKTNVLNNLKKIFKQNPIESKKTNDIRKSAYIPITKAIIIKQNEANKANRYNS